MALFGRPTPQDDAKAAAYRDWLLRRDPYAIGSTVLGVFSLTHLGALWVDGIAAIILGVVALRRLSRLENAGPTRELASFWWLGRPTRTFRWSRLAESSGETAKPQESNGLQGRGLAWLGIVAASLSIVIAIVLFRWA